MMISFIRFVLLVFSVEILTGKSVSFDVVPYSVQNSKNLHDASYTAAVVEYQSEGSPWENTGEEIIAKNLEKYLEFIANAALAGADIIVFPEYGLTTLGMPRDRNASKPFLLNVPNIGHNPCEDKATKEIKDLSCASRSFNIYVVVNLGEIRKCEEKDENCPKDGVYQYNTNVVFDRFGTIVAKYEKGNLYFEEQFDKPDPIQLSTFETDFGTFGLFTCYDIIFHDPAVKLVENGVRNFIFPTAWVDELPFLMAIQAQSSWAIASNSNLLASGYHQPLGGQLGSGIYAGVNGAVTYSFDSNSGSTLLLASIPILPTSNMHATTNFVKSSSHISAYHSFLREDLSNYTTKTISLENSSETVCTEMGFCCELEYALTNTSVNPNSLESYRVIAFNGTRTVAAKTSSYHWQVCAVVRCLNDTVESCSENNKASSESELPTFQQFRLKSHFDFNAKFYPLLSTLDTNFDLISPKLFSTETDVDQSIMQIASSSLSFINVKTISMINKIFN